MESHENHQDFGEDSGGSSLSEGEVDTLKITRTYSVSKEALVGLGYGDVEGGVVYVNGGQELALFRQNSL